MHNEDAFKECQLTTNVGNNDLFPAAFICYTNLSNKTEKLQKFMCFYIFVLLRL